ncbi:MULTISPECIES: phage antirepressor KilAC domain-containing protein [unclassified Pseudomonas]|uniref:phage antirepressor KilAC domain-containing protein n=1 Tax=unclassified Pseudomonas TaxID=196821 RepID=UPI00244B8514|nr:MULTISPECIES: phage antirepressor KilAC domain-containing protein [unclassified Pseudomonas]MDH0894249.1 phage antirepressor KilAC domain-containing protein [Pseudomonas sp. GD03875]MDH1063456.1 phage antirepressor KilAC domain-containing protein [Pseudomonas sp. GD03985]
MNRTLKAAAQALGMSENALRAWLREHKHLNHDGSLAAQHVAGGHLFEEPRTTQPRQLGFRKHYAVIKVTEKGLAWLAAQLRVEIKKDHVA